MTSTHHARTLSALYDKWMAFSLVIQKIVVTTLFALIYLLIVPWFALVAGVLFLVRPRSRNTRWTVRRQVVLDESFFQRLG